MTFSCASSTSSGLASVLDAQANLALTSVDLWTDESSAVKTLSSTDPYVEVTFDPPVFVYYIYLVPNTVGLTGSQADAAYCDNLSFEISDTSGVYTTCGTISSCATSYRYVYCNESANSIRLSRTCTDCQISY